MLLIVGGVLNTSSSHMMISRVVARVKCLRGQIHMGEGKMRQNLLSIPLVAFENFPRWRVNDFA